MSTVEREKKRRKKKPQKLYAEDAAKLFKKINEGKRFENGIPLSKGCAIYNSIWQLQSRRSDVLPSRIFKHFKQTLPSKKEPKLKKKSQSQIIMGSPKIKAFGINNHRLSEIKESKPLYLEDATKLFKELSNGIYLKNRVPLSMACSVFSIAWKCNPDKNAEITQNALFRHFKKVLPSKKSLKNNHVQMEALETNIDHLYPDDLNASGNIIKPTPIDIETVSQRIDDSHDSSPTPMALNLSFAGNEFDTSDVEETTEALDWIRKKWDVGSMCEVYSKKTDTWIQGKILRRIESEDGEWMDVEYVLDDESITTKILRDDESSVRPLIKAQSLYNYVYDAVH